MLIWPDAGVSVPFGRKGLFRVKSRRPLFLTVIRVGCCCDITTMPSFCNQIYIIFLCILFGILTPNHVSCVILPTLQRPDCFQEVPACVPLTGGECFGVSLPYQFAAPGAFAQEVATLADVSMQLQLWSALRNVPQCWEKIQPLLCFVYLPRCIQDAATATSDNVTSSAALIAQLPSRELCDVVQTPCHVVELYGGWPDYLRCDQWQFNKGCSVSFVILCWLQMLCQSVMLFVAMYGIPNVFIRVMAWCKFLVCHWKCINDHSHSQVVLG